MNHERGSGMMADYGLYSCWHCLCEVCTRVGCPKFSRKSKLGFCTTMIMRESCPTIKCDWFVHKQKHKVYRVRARFHKKDAILEKLNMILEKLDTECEK